MWDVTYRSWWDNKAKTVIYNSAEEAIEEIAKETRNGLTVELVYKKG